MEKPFLAPWLYEEQATGLFITMLILLQEFLMIIPNDSLPTPP